MLLSARCERVATSLNRIVSDDTFPTLSSLDKPMEQWVNLKFLVKLGKTFAEAYAMLKEVYGNECLSRTQFKRFKEGRETTESASRRPSTSKTDENIEKVGKIIRDDRRLNIRGLAEITGIDKECVGANLLESWCQKSSLPSKRNQE
ncbi:hypothetical protein NQ318_010245 [Aromia moschata]|uniref:Mos1 transposase HTH domain-containing protein n=1 Tax=Aromia moschata TaxID=1265417 RepID=A0AAV8YIW9_9CUCU|nr:hypothetical protein NQ318_010245 [Aromia moschata]